MAKTILKKVNQNLKRQTRCPNRPAEPSLPGGSCARTPNGMVVLAENFLQPGGGVNGSLRAGA